jgi:integrase
MDNQTILENAVQWILKGHLPIQEKVLVILLLRNGLRVSEISDPSGIKKIDDYSVSVYTNKTKSYRTCALAEAAQLEKEYQVLADIGSWKRNRWYYYRLLKGLFPDIETNRTGNQAVTHAARNIRAQQTYQATQSVEAAQSSLGHKSPKSTQTYLKQRPRNAKVFRGIDDEISGTLNNLQVTKHGVLRQSVRT